MRPYALLYFYRRRLRVHAMQELLAGVGIAIAVALVSATLVAEGSIADSAGEVVHAVVGPANLQLRARDVDGSGFDESMLARVQALPGVKQTARLLEQSATVRGPDGRRTQVDLAGADTSLAVLDGLAHTLPIAALAPGGIGLSRTSANALGIGTRGTRAQRIRLDLRGHSYSLNVGAVLGPEAAGALSQAFVAVMSLRRMQELAGLRGRITRILIETKPGAEASVRARLQALAGGRLVVARGDQDVAVLREALRPSALASGLFAAIGALLGFLLAFNAMLLTVPERRRAIADLRIAGTRRSAIVQMVLFQALCLGVAASLVGLLAGWALSAGVLHQSSSYLAEAFTLAGGTVVHVRPLLLSALGGVSATCLASALPLLDLRRGRARDQIYVHSGVPGNALGGGTQRRLFTAAVGLTVLAGALFALSPAAAIPAVAALALATVLAVPLVFLVVLRVVASYAERNDRLTSLPVALASLRATTLRSLALAAMGAVALFGSIALGGSRASLLRGIEGFSHSYVSDADLWVTNPGDNQATNAFAPATATARIARLGAVASVHAFRGGFLQLGDRRVWIIARPPGDANEVLSSQIVDGNTNAAIAHLGEGGWIAVSQQIAEERHVGVGDTLSLPTPTGLRRFRLAATTTNLAWSPGVIFMAAADYSRAWHTSAATALGVDLRPGMDAVQARGELARALASSTDANANSSTNGNGNGNGLEVSLAHAQQTRIDALTSEGLNQLGEISTLLLLAAIAAMAAALGSSIWQRRAWLSGLRLAGAKPQRLRRILLIEAALMLGAGCLTGAIAGAFGQVVIDAYLKRVTGFPLAGVVTGARPVEVFALVLAASLALASIPGWLASRVSPMLALQGE
jgi:putative ABC transport system permease protein